jgi:dolichol-phosphate mannosyltransferase
MSQRRLISICVPVYNEEDNVRPLYERLAKTLEGLAGRYDFEILFTDNHSEDATFERLAELALADTRIRVIRFSRNFGFQRSVLANYANARGEAAIQIDCDLQDPPELFAEFIRRWEEGYQVVYGIRRSRPRENWFLVRARKSFYRLIDRLSEDNLPHDAGDFRLVDRRVLDQLRDVRDQQPYVRGLIAAMGFRQIGVPYDRAPRARGQSKFKLRHLIGLAFDGILHHSTVPLRIATTVGLAAFALTFLAIIYYFVAWLLFGRDWPQGWTTLAILVLFGIGLNALLLGIIGEYIGRIFKNVKTLPLVIVEDVIDHTGRAPVGPARAEPPAAEKRAAAPARPAE